MRSRQYPLVFFTTTLLLTVAGRSGFAFSLTGVTTSSEVNYTLSDGSTGSVATYSLQIVSPPDDTQNFMTTLKNTFPNWTFNKATNDLAGSFNILEYYPCERNTPCGVERNLSLTGEVGAFIDLKYNPGDGDPTLAENNIHWIHRVFNNYNVTDNPGYGNSEDIIDLSLVSQGNPYYDYYYSYFDPYLTSDYFVDRPYRRVSILSPPYEVRWYGELYLVEETAPQTVRIYNGILWGWTNTVTPPSDPCNGGGGSGGGGCSRTLVDQRGTLSSNNSVFPTSVPEPISVLGLLGLGAWGIFQGLKIRNEK